jgi:hypothetical protein
VAATDTEHSELRPITPVIGLEFPKATASIRFTEPEPPMGDAGTAQPRSHPDGAPG